MAWELIASLGIGSSDSNSITTGNINTLNADLIVLSIGWWSNADANNPVLPIVDSLSNSYTAATMHGSGPNRRHRFFYKFNPTTNATHSFSLTSTASPTYPSMLVSAWRYAQGPSIGDEDGATEGTSNTTLVIPSVTTTVDDSLILQGCCHSNIPEAQSINNGYTIIQSVGYDEFGNNDGAALAWKARATAGVDGDTTWTWAASGGVTGQVGSAIVFNPFVASAVVPSFPQFRMVRR